MSGMRSSGTRTTPASGDHAINVGPRQKPATHHDSRDASRVVYVHQRVTLEQG